MPASKLSEMATIFGLTVGCPYGGCNPPHCQLHKVRKLPAAARWSFVRQLDPERRRQIIATHAACAARRTNEVQKAAS